MLDTAQPRLELTDGKVLCEILRHAEWRIKCLFPSLSKLCLRLCGQPSHWALLGSCLADEFGLYVPGIDGFVTRALFVEELWPTRHLFAPLPPPASVAAAAAAAQQDEPSPEGAAESVQDVESELSLTVCCRFRPEVADAGGEATDKSVVVPLHQRIQQVCASRGVSRREAMRLVMSNRVPAPDIPFKDGAAADAGAGGGGDGAGGGLPQLGAQKAGVMQLETTAPRGDVLAMVPGVGLRSFHFARVFGQATPQRSVFTESGARVVVDVVNGPSGSVIVYGQTGSGKTHTMFGATDGHDDSAHMGIVPRSFEMVLDAVRSRRQRGVDVRLSMAYIEIYGDELRDLLNGGRIVGQGVEGRHADTRATDRVGHRYVLDGDVDVDIAAEDGMPEVAGLLRRGDAEKRRSSTAMNERSTRAHAVIVLSLSQSCVDDAGAERLVSSKLMLADLGGSEKISKSKTDEGTKPKVMLEANPDAPDLAEGEVAKRGWVDVDGNWVESDGGGGMAASGQWTEANRITWAEYNQSRKKLQETVNINLGLFALKRCISALVRRQLAAREGNTQEENRVVVPYRDSKLTQLLAGSLGGAAKTLIIVCAAMESQHIAETVQTLRFGEQCSTVQSGAGAADQSVLTSAIAAIDAQIEECKRLIKRDERWEMRTRKVVSRVPLLDNVKRDDTGTIILSDEREPTAFQDVENEVQGQVLVGAEKHHTKLESLLANRAQLLGEQ
jgi:hypothetical protein